MLQQKTVNNLYTTVTRPTSKLGFSPLEGDGTVSYFSNPPYTHSKSLDKTGKSSSGAIDAVMMGQPGAIDAVMMMGQPGANTSLMENPTEGDGAEQHFLQAELATLDDGTIGNSKSGDLTNVFSVTTYTEVPNQLPEAMQAVVECLAVDLLLPMRLATDTAVTTDDCRLQSGLLINKLPSETLAIAPLLSVDVPTDGVFADFNADMHVSMSTVVPVYNYNAPVGSNIDTRIASIEPAMPFQLATTMLPDAPPPASTDHLMDDIPNQMQVNAPNDEPANTSVDCIKLVLPEKSSRVQMLPDLTTNSVPDLVLTSASRSLSTETDAEDVISWTTEESADSDYQTESSVSGPVQSFHSFTHAMRKNRLIYAFKIKRKFLPTKCAYFFFYGAKAILFANFMVFLQWAGLEPYQAGLIQGTMMAIVTVTASLWGLIADKTQRHLLILNIQNVMSTLFLLAMPLSMFVLRPHGTLSGDQVVSGLAAEFNNSRMPANVDNIATTSANIGNADSKSSVFIVMLCLSIGHAVFGGGISIIIDSLVLTLTKKASKGTGTFGRQRLFGSISFAIFPVAGGMLTESANMKSNTFLPAFLLVTLLSFCLLISCVYLVKIYRELLPACHHIAVEEVVPAIVTMPTLDPITDDILKECHISCTSSLHAISANGIGVRVAASKSHSIDVEDSMTTGVHPVSSKLTSRCCSLVPSRVSILPAVPEVATIALVPIPAIHSVDGMPYGQVVEDSSSVSNTSIPYEPIIDSTPVPACNSNCGETSLCSNLMRAPVLLFLLKVFQIGVCGGTQWACLYLMMNEMAASKTLMGLTILFQCTFETFTMPAGNLIARKLRSNDMAMLVGIMGYSMGFYFCYIIRTPEYVIAVCICFGISYAVFYSASMDELYKVTEPHHVTTMLGIYTAIYAGLGFAAASVSCGMLYTAYGPQVTLVIIASALTLLCAMQLIHIACKSVVANKARQLNVNLADLTQELVQTSYSSPHLYGTDVKQSLLKTDEMTDEEATKSQCTAAGKLEKYLIHTEYSLAEDDIGINLQDKEDILQQEIDLVEEFIIGIQMDAGIGNNFLESEETKESATQSMLLALKSVPVLQKYDGIQANLNFEEA